MSQRRKTLKSKIHNYISKNQDICCEREVDRKVVIQQIVEKYKKVCQSMNEPGEYLNYINNDLVKFIGYKDDLKKNRDVEGAKLWNQMDKLMQENKIVSEQKIELLLQDVPLYFLLSVLGYASYKESFIV